MFSDGDVLPWINLINRDYVNSWRWTQVFVTKIWTELLDAEPQTGQNSMKEVSNYPADVAPVVLFFPANSPWLLSESRDTDDILMVGRTDGSFHITSERTPGLISKERSKGRVCEALQSRVCHFFKGLQWCLSHVAPPQMQRASPSDLQIPAKVLLWEDQVFYKYTSSRYPPWTGR